MQAVNEIDPQTLNMYTYCGNDPVNYVDPSGLFFGRFFRWLGNLIMSLFRSGVAKKIAVRFVVSFIVSGGNFGVAIRSIVPEILGQLGLNPNPLLTPTWNPKLSHPLSSGVSSLNRYIIVNYAEDVIVDGGELAVVVINISWWDTIVDTAKSVLDFYRNANAGGLNFFTFGYSSELLNEYSSRPPDTNSVAYAYGEYCGMAASLVIPGGAAVKGAQAANKAQQLFRAGKVGNKWFGRHKVGRLNRNDHVRIGWSWQGSAKNGKEVFRIAIGSKRGRIHKHVKICNKK